MIYKLNNDIIYVSGIKHGAIYNFNDGKVYWVKNTLNEEIQVYFSSKKATERIDQMIENGLINPDLAQEVNLQDINVKPHNVLAWLELTQACNLKCVHCYDGCEHRSLENALSLEEWKKIISTLKENGFQKVILIGGEPLASTYFEELLKYCVAIQIQTEVFSNLTLMNESLFKLIVESKSEVHFSLYGVGEKHDEITQVNGSYDKTVYWAKRFVESGIKVIPSVVYMKENYYQRDAIEKVLKEIGIKPRHGDAIRPMESGEQSPHMLTKEQIKDFEIHTPNFKADKSLFYSNIAGNSCLRGKLAINQNGEVYPCEFMRNSIGNVRKEGLEKILSKLKNDIWNITHEQISECKDCEFRFVCKDCRHLVLDENKKKYRCFYSPSDGEFK